MKGKFWELKAMLLLKFYNFHFSWISLKMFFWNNICWKEMCNNSGGKDISKAVTKFHLLHYDFFAVHAC